MAELRAYYQLVGAQLILDKIKNKRTDSKIVFKKMTQVANNLREINIEALDEDGKKQLEILIFQYESRLELRRRVLS